jgi:hypothetical protein
MGVASASATATSSGWPGGGSIQARNAPQVGVLGGLLPGSEVEAEDLGGGQQGLVAGNGGTLDQVGEVLAEADHLGGLGGRAGAGVAQPVGEQVQQPHGGGGGHPHLRVKPAGLAPGEVVGQHGAQPGEQGVLGVAVARVGDEVEPHRPATAAPAAGEDGHVLPGHLDRRQQHGVRLDADLLAGDAHLGAALVPGPQAQQRVVAGGHGLLAGSGAAGALVSGQVGAEPLDRGGLLRGRGGVAEQQRGGAAQVADAGQLTGGGRAQQHRAGRGGRLRLARLGHGTERPAHLLVGGGQLLQGGQVGQVRVRPQHRGDLPQVGRGGVSARSSTATSWRTD